MFNKKEYQREYHKKYYRKNRQKMIDRSKKYVLDNSIAKSKNTLCRFNKRSGLKITIDEYHNLIKTNNGLCEICNKKNKSNITLSIDHDHKTGKVRGLLCSNCNTGLGLFKDDIKLLKFAIKYLERI